MSNGAVFAIKVQDDDQDILRVNFAPVRNFDVYNGWKYNNPVPSNSDTLYDTGKVDFDDFDTDAKALFKNTSTIYVRAIDAKGNISDIYEITGMNIN